MLVAHDEATPDRVGRESLVSADVEDLGARAEDDRHEVGVTRQTSHGSWRELLTGVGHAEPRAVAQVVELHHQIDPWRRAVALGKELSGLESMACLDQGVEQTSAVVAGVTTVVGAPGQPTRRGLAWRIGERLRFAERQQRGADHRGVLGAAAALDERPTELVVGDGEVTVEMGGALLALELSLGSPVLALGVDDLEQSPPDLAKLAGVETLGLVEHHLDAAGTDLVCQRERVDGSVDHLRLGPRQPAVGKGGGHRCPHRLVQ